MEVARVHNLLAQMIRIGRAGLFPRRPHSTSPGEDGLLVRLDLCELAELGRV